jgi:predicted PurR-regulated permease PerM
MGPDLLERHAALRVLLYAITVVAVLYAGGLLWSVVLHFGGIILIFFLAWVLAFMLFPLAAYLERRGMPRLLAVSLIYAALVGIVVGGIVLSIPLLHSQVQQFGGQITSTFSAGNLQGLSTRAVTWLHRLGLSRADAAQLVDQVSSRLPGLANNLSQQAANIAEQLLGTVATLLFDVTLVAVISFYMMLSGDRLLDACILKLPPAWLADVRLFQRHVEVIFGGFLRAQLITSASYGLLTGVMLLLVGFWQYALILGVLAAVLMLIPFIGVFLAIVPPLAVVLLQSPPDARLRNAIIVFAGLMVAQHLVLNLLAPKIMSAHVGVHPLILFAALLVGAQEAGTWGAIFAGPAAAFIVTVLDTFFERFQLASPLYPDLHGPPGDEDGYRDGYREELAADEQRRRRADRRARREADAEMDAEEKLASGPR